jgi:hypothetical protein
MSTKQLLYSLPEFPRWINPASVTVGLIGFLPILSLFSHFSRNALLIDRLLPSVVAVLLVTIFILVPVHERLHYCCIRLSCLLWRRIHPTFHEEQILV